MMAQIKITLKAMRYDDYCEINILKLEYFGCGRIFRLLPNNACLLNFVSVHVQLSFKELQLKNALSSILLILSRVFI